MKLKYAKSNRLSAKAAKEVARELTKIQKSASVITPAVVVETASDPKSPLHKYFEWNDGNAARKYREWQARYLILSVYIVDSSDENAVPIRAFANCTPDDDDEFIADRGYVAITSIVGRQNYQAQVLEYARQQLVGWKGRFGHYKEFFEVTQAIESVTK